MRRAPLLLVALAVVLAGCGATAGPAASPTPTAEASASDTPTATPTPTTTATEVPVAEANPYGTRTLYVRLNHSSMDADRAQQVRDALQYWEQNSERHAGYPIRFVLANTSNPDVVIRFADPPVECGYGSEEAIGCAPQVGERAPTPPLSVTLASNHSPHLTYEIAVHELGHLLGLDHADTPQRYMQARLPHGVARDRVRVALTRADGNVSDGERREATRALEWYATADEPDRHLNYTVIEDPTHADLVIEFADDADDCEVDRGSCPLPGAYVDQDRIVIVDLETDRVGWHVAYQLAPAFFDGDPPPELSRSADVDTRTGDWDD